MWQTNQCIIDVKGHYVLWPLCRIENITGNVIWSVGECKAKNDCVLFHYNLWCAPGSFRVYMPNQLSSTRQKAQTKIKDKKKIANTKTQNLMTWRLDLRVWLSASWMGRALFYFYFFSIYIFTCLLIKGAQNSSFLLLQNTEKALWWGTEGFKYF